MTFNFKNLLCTMEMKKVKVKCEILKGTGRTGKSALMMVLYNETGEPYVNYYEFWNSVVEKVKKIHQSYKTSEYYVVFHSVNIMKNIECYPNYMHITGANYIEEKVFMKTQEDASQLSELIIEKEEGMTVIRPLAFGYCRNLKTISLTNCLLSDGAFQGVVPNVCLIDSPNVNMNAFINKLSIEMDNEVMNIQAYPRKTLIISTPCWNCEYKIYINRVHAPFTFKGIEETEISDIYDATEKEIVKALDRCDPLLMHYYHYKKAKEVIDTFHKIFPRADVDELKKKIDDTYNIIEDNDPIPLERDTWNTELVRYIINIVPQRIKTRIYMFGEKFIGNVTETDIAINDKSIIITVKRKFEKIFDYNSMEEEN